MNRTTQVDFLIGNRISALRVGIRRAKAPPMVFYRPAALVSRLAVPFLFCAIAATAQAGQSFLRAAAETNVNQRYTIESISIAGVRVENAKIPASLRHRLNAMIGERCDVATLEDLAGDLRKALHLHAVTQHLLRGSEPGRIHVDFEVIRKELAFDLSVPKLLYHSVQGWTGEIDASTRFRENTFTAGVTSNGDDLAERFTGVVARYEDSKVGTEKVRFGVGFEDYHEQWGSQARVAAIPSLDLYRTRMNIAPEVTIAVAKTLTISGGLSFEQMQSENPAVGVRSANAITGEIHYGHKIEGNTNQQTIDGKYTLRSGTRGLGSDYSYSRHMVTLRYELKSGRQTASDEFIGGALMGQAPIFERFVLGSSSTLRGWDRSAIDPLGGDRVIHNSLAWNYQLSEGSAEVFYDSGMVWQTGRPTPLRHSIGAGYRQGIFVLTMAFPLIQGRISPVFMAGMSY